MSDEAGRGVTYTIDPTNVVSEVFDHEVVAINLESGVYYSITGSGPAIWSLLGRPVSAAQIDEALVAAFDAPAPDLVAARVRFIEALRREALIIAEDATRGPMGTLRPSPPDERGAFAEPTVERFEDLAELIKLDPVHDIPGMVIPATTRAGTA